MKKIIIDNIELFIKIMVLLSSIFVVTPLPFINTSLYFWMGIAIVVVFNLFLLIKDFREYIRLYLWEMLFIIVCLFSSLLNIKYMNIYSVVYTLFTANLIFSLLPRRKENNNRFILETKVIDGIIVVYTFVLVTISFISLFVFNLHEIREILSGGRFGGVYLNPNQAAFWAFTSIVISYKYLNKQKYFVIMNLVLESVLIILSGCRSVYIAYITFIFYLVFKSKKNINLKKLIFCFIIILSFSLIGISFFRYKWYIKYFHENSWDNFINVATGLRYFVWKDAFNIFLKNPIFGVGVNNLQSAAKELLGEGSYYVIGNWEDTHNILISLLAYTGSIGFGLFAKLIYNYFIKCLNSKLGYDLIVIISFLIIAMLDIGVLFDDRILSFAFWYFVGNIINKTKGVYEESKVL